MLNRGYGEALGAAGLFALSVPLAKLLLGEVAPLPLASLLYLGAGLSTGISLLFTPHRGHEARLKRADLPWLLGAALAGGVLGPISLLYGLQGTPAATASLLLTSENVATALIAALLFGEFVGRRAWAAIGLITVGVGFLSLTPGGQWGFSPQALLVLLACLMWGLDNNLTRHISLRDPRAIVVAKGLLAGSFSLSLGVWWGATLPPLRYALLGLALGAVSYGLSILLFVRALRSVGAARTGALFGLAPFLAAALSLLLFREPPSWGFFAALPPLAGGAYLLLVERHVHLHVHQPLAHEHRHRHDDGHHLHPHPPGVAPQGPHSHFHVHPRLVHSHPHFPDIHHRHRHP
jgi:drug/metabolite transporter (DMT)-like permease